MVAQTNKQTNNHIYLIDSETGVRTEITKDIPGLHFHIDGSNNTIEILTPIGLYRNCTIYMEKCNGAHVRFENNIYLKECFFSIYNGENQKCVIEKYTSFAGGAVINVHNNSSLHIGTDCMFSSNIVIWTSDGHSLFDAQTNKLLNHPQECLRIGNHCWVGFGGKIFKGGGLADNSVLAGESVLTKRFDEPNIVVAGNPARMVRRDIGWSRLPPQEFQENN